VGEGAGVPREGDELCRSALLSALPCGQARRDSQARRAALKKERAPAANGAAAAAAAEKAAAAKQRAEEAAAEEAKEGALLAAAATVVGVAPGPESDVDGGEYGDGAASSDMEMSLYSPEAEDTAERSGRRKSATSPLSLSLSRTTPTKSRSCSTRSRRCSTRERNSWWPRRGCAEPRGEEGPGGGGAGGGGTLHPRHWS